MKIAGLMKYTITKGKGSSRKMYSNRWQDRIFSGHFTFWRITVFGANAMHWAVNVRGKRNWWCFHWRTRTFGVVWPWYFYVSPDATPYSAVYKTGQ